MHKRKRGSFRFSNLAILIALILAGLVFSLSKSRCAISYQFAVSGLDGLYLYQDGEVDLLVAVPLIESIDWSPDGTKIAFSVTNDSMNQSDIYYLELSTGAAVKVSNESDSFNIDPRWSPDGKFIAFTRHYGSSTETWSNPELWLADLEELESQRVIASDVTSYDWSIENILYFTAHGDIYTYSIDGDNVSINTLSDGNRVFTSVSVSESGRYAAWFTDRYLNIYHSSRPLWEAIEWKTQTSVPFAYWSHDDGVIFYQTLDGIQMMDRKQGVWLATFEGTRPDWSSDDQVMSTHIVAGKYRFYEYNEETFVYGELCDMSLPGDWLTFRPQG